MEELSVWTALAERRIAEAIARGDFDNLPGAGKPLALEDDPLVPEELRIAYRLLRNAGFLPPELEAVAEIGALLAAVQRDVDAAAGDAGRRLRVLALKLEASGRPVTAARAWHDYEEALARRLQRQG